MILFVYTSLSKLLEFNDFQSQLSQSPIVSALANPVSYGVIILELVVSFLLSFDRTRKIGLYGAYAVMVMFTVYIVTILNFTTFTPCSCGGVLENLGWTEHLIFNSVFIFLALLAIFLKEEQGLKYAAIKLLVLFVSATTIIIALYMSSEKEIKHNNAFQRRYIPHGLKKTGDYQLESNGYYIAGIDDNTIYLGNYMAPLFLKLLNIKSDNQKDVWLTLDNTDLPYKRARIRVEAPYFFIGDGTVPILLRGNIDNWKAKTFSLKEAYFNQFVPMDSLQLALLTTSTETKSNALGILNKRNSATTLFLNKTILDKQIHGTFDTDGMLLNNSKSKLLYVYYYRNEYMVINHQLTPDRIGKTIDTISKANLDIIYLQGKGQYVLGGKSIVINKYTTAYGDYLLINSDRLGKHESDDILKAASIIDMYNSSENTYLQSFYLYHQVNGKLLDFKLYKNLLVAIVDDRVWVYHLDSKYFN
ncbi:hypothetical protein A9996_15065 [Gelidibacter algens]|nr:hypothetical protein A9996_15065 [Gelidibacter algens]